MKFLTHNRILKNTILGLLVAFVLLAPLSLGVGVGGGERSGDVPAATGLTLSTNVAFSADPAAGGTPSNSVPVKDLNWDQKLGVTFMKIGAWLAGGGGVLLHLSMTKLVIGMGDLIVHKGYGEAINANWAVIRDICNLVFIFGFIYIGIRTIIDYDSPTTKRFLSQIIIGALLINFSLFITKAVIDFSNFTAMQVYTAMAPERGEDGTFDVNYGIAAQYANLMGLSGIYGSQGWQDGENATGPAYSSFTFYLIAMVVLMIAAFVFAAGAILLVVRFAALVLIMIFSPLLFAATVFPKTAKYASDLWSKLFSYAFFAPVYFFLLLLSATVLSKSSNALGTTNKDLGEGIMLPSSDSLTVLLQFFLVIFFLILSLKIAQSMGVKGGDMAVKIGGDIRRGAQGAVGRGVLGANINGYGLGAGMDKIVKTQDSWRKSDSKWARAGALALRGTGASAAAGKVTGAKFGSSRSYSDVQKENKEIDRAREKNKQVTQAENNISRGASSTTGSQGRIDMERSIANASSEQLLALLKSFKKDSPEYKALVGNMTAGQFDGLMKAKPEDLDDGQKAKLRTARSGAVSTRLNITSTSGATPGSPGDITKANSGDLEALDFATLKEHAGHLKMKQIDDMKGLTPTEKTVLKDERKRILVDEAITQGNVAAVFNRFTADEERAKLPVAILADPTTAPLLTVRTLHKIADNDDFSALQLGTIKANVLVAHQGVQQYVDFFNTPQGQKYA